MEDSRTVDSMEAVVEPTGTYIRRVLGFSIRFSLARVISEGASNLGESMVRSHIRTFNIICATSPGPFGVVRGTLDYYPNFTMK
jgi:hypothetical protein